MEMHERLALARKEAGFLTKTAAAEALGVSYPTYAGHENGNSGFRAPTAAKYARRFKVRFEWLLRGTGPMRDDSDAAEALDLFSQILPKLPDARRERLVSDLLDAARLEGVEGFFPAPLGSVEKKGE